MNFNHFLKLSLKTYAVPVLLLVVLVGLRSWLGQPFAYFTRDPVDTAGYPFYLGLYSNINMVVWGFVTGVLWFTYGVLMKDRPESPMRMFFLTSSITTTVLYLDDFFQFHERIFPDYLGVPQVLIVGTYGAWTVAFLVTNFRTIMAAEGVLLFSAIAFLGASAVIDFLDEVVRLPGHHLWEDGTKFLGIVGWCVYFVRTSYAWLSGRLPGQAATFRPPTG